jgi:hypothetical protein
MAPLSFLKSSVTSSPARRAESPADAQARTRSPSPEPSGPSRYNPARLLRRRPSTSQKQSAQPARASMDSQPSMPGMVSAGSEIESSEQETEGPQTASSAFFSDIGDHHAGLSNGSENIGEGGFTSPSRILGSPRSKREGGIWSGGGTNLMDTIPDSNPGSGPPPWLADQTSQSLSRRIMDPSEILLDESAMPGPGPPRQSAASPYLSPSGPMTSQPYYPTALSPPRRPMGKSPQPRRSTPPPLAPALSTSSSFSAFPPDQRPAHTSSLSVEQAPTRGHTHRSSSSDGRSEDLVDLQNESKRPVVSAEWLARKPSSSRLGRQNSNGGDQSATSPFAKRRVLQKSRPRPDVPRQDSDSQSASHDSDAEAQPGNVGKRRSISIRDGYEIEVDCDDSHWPGNDDEEGEMIWQVRVRRQPRGNRGLSSANTANASSPLHLSSHKSTATAPATASSINLSLSLDQPTGKLVFIAFPMDLHATPKRRGSSTKRTSGAGPPTPPLPPSPRDLFSAGADSRSSSASTPSSQRITPPPLPTYASGPSTPPPIQPSTPQSRTASRLDRPEYPVTPTRVRLSGQFSPGAGSAGNMTSPRSRGASSVARSLSPAFSNGTPGSAGNGYITPGTYSTPTTSARRTKLVNAPDLEGGLYARGTVDGLSEELEGASLSPR